MKLFHYFGIVVFILLFLTGCTGSGKPKGMPDLYPCSLTFTQEGKPVDAMLVILYGKHNDIWTISGVTDEQGTAIINTQDKFPGVPAGEYTIVLTKTVSENSTKQAYSSVMTYSLIPKKYTDSAVSPLNITIEAAPFQKNIELGKPVKEPMSKS